MRIHMTDSRERMLDALLEATGESTKSKAIDRAINHYLKCRGDNLAHPNGRYEELMQLASEQGSVTPSQIAPIIGTEELPVTGELSWSVGSDD